MVQIHRGLPSVRGQVNSKIGEALGMSLGQGLGEFTGQYNANKALESVLNDEELKKKPLSERWGALQTKLAPHGKFGQAALQQRIQIEQQAEQEKVQGVLAKYNKGAELTEEEEAMIPVAYRQKEMELKNKPAAGGTTSQPVPPFVAEAIEKVINENPDASPSQLGVAFAKANIPPIYTTSYIENKRRETEQAQKTFEGDRTYHTNISKEEVKKANELRSSIPKKENALRFARDAVQTGNVSYFSPDKLADATGIELFRTAKGAQLITAGKENLLSNMERVSAKAQNVWFEKRLNSVFPEIGKSREANLTVQEMIEGEVAADKAYLQEFDRISEEDRKKYGYVREDVSKRAREAAEPKDKKILQRTSYRIKEIQEQEEGLSALKSRIGQKVEKGTPLTLAMAKLYKDKFGDQALKVAKDNGYYIPSIEEFREFQNPNIEGIFE